MFKTLIENPIFMKDFTIMKHKETRKKFRVPGYVGYLAVLFLPLVLLSTYGAIESSRYGSFDFDSYVESAKVITIYLQLFYFIFKSISYSFNLFIREKENKTFESLIASQMSPVEILKGKFMVVFYPLFLELTGLLPVFFLLGLLFKFKLAQILGIYLINLLSIVFFTLIGFYASLVSKNSRQAHSWASLASGFFLVGTLIFDGIFSTLVSEFVPIMIFLNPGATLAAVSFTSYDGPAWFKFLTFIQPLAMLMLSWILWEWCLNKISKIPEH